jgi:[acyl-carrier-protein] S-malonyltransferase
VYPRIVHLRGRFMQESVPEGVGKMSAVVGAEIGKIIDICKDVSDEGSLAVPANINTPEQLVVSGAAARKSGARKVVELAVSVPSHSPLMAEAAEKLAGELSGVRLQDLKVPLVSNVEALPVTNGSEIRGLLKRQLTSPVRWVDIIRRMKTEGVKATLEIGPGRVLSGLVRRIDSEIETYNFGEPGDLEKLSGLVGSA